MGEEIKLLTINELADLFRCTRETISAYRKQGMPVFSIRPVRFEETKCLEWLRNRK
jgi:phage terminase Nu1 subunit (DNA packaging protein)